MKVMVAFLGKKKNKREDYLEQIKKIHKSSLSLGKKINKTKDYFNINKKET